MASTSNEFHDMTEVFLEAQVEDIRRRGKPRTFDSKSLDTKDFEVRDIVGWRAGSGYPQDEYKVRWCHVEMDESALLDAHKNTIDGRPVSDDIERILLLP